MLIRSMISLLSRIFLAGILLVEVLRHFALHLGNIGTGNGPVLELDFPMVLPFEEISHALMAITAIWILFGVQPRIAAIVGLIGYATCAWSEEITSPSNVTLATWLVPIALGIIIVLIGGGRFSIYRDDWHQIL